MQISELIKELCEVMQNHGDMQVDLTPDPRFFRNKYNHNAFQVSGVRVADVRDDIEEPTGVRVAYILESGLESEHGRYNHIA